MLSYSVRAFTAGLRAATSDHVDPYAPVVQRFVAWPWYCDQNLHINNAQYLTFMDFGRIAWLVRIGLWRTLGADRRALVAGLGMTYRREIRAMQPFELHTQVAAGDDRWAYVVQSFMVDGGQAARGIVRMCFRGPDGLIPVGALLGAPPPPPTDEVRAWSEGVDAAYRHGGW
jgi:acyl-CoA thioesterase FadM